MVTVAALEAISTGTTTIVENVGDIARTAAALAESGLRCVFAESIRDSENVPGPMSQEGLARSERPNFRPGCVTRGSAHQRSFRDLARGKGGTHQRFPGGRPRRDLVARAAARDPRVRGEARPQLHDSLVAEPRRSRLHGAIPWPSSAGFSRPRRFPRSAAVRGALPLRRPVRHRSAGPIEHHHLAPGEHGREPRSHPADRQTASRQAARSRTAPTTTPTICSA